MATRILVAVVRNGAMEGSFASLADVDLAGDVEMFLACLKEKRKADLLGIEPWHMTVFGPWDSAPPHAAWTARLTEVDAALDPAATLGTLVNGMARAYFLVRITTPPVAAGMGGAGSDTLAGGAGDAVTLMLKSRGKYGSTVPATFGSPAKFEDFVKTHDVYLTSKDGRKKKLVLSLAEAQCVDGDYLQLTAPFDVLDDKISNLESHRLNGSAGHEQATTAAVADSVELRKEYGELRAIAGGHGVLFFDSTGEMVLQADGLIVNSVVVLLNEAKHKPTLADVDSQLSRKVALERILKRASEFTTVPPDVLEAMAGITTVVPVLSGYYFEAAVESECKATGVRAFKTNGKEYCLAG